MKQKKSQIYLLTLLVITVFFTLPLKAQVNIGSQDSPHPFSILELTTTKNNHGGLRMPQLDNDERVAVEAKFNESAATAEAAKGLLIYNTDSGCLEFWNGKEWISLCSNILPPPPTLEAVPTSLLFAYNETGTGNSKTVDITTNQTTWSVTSMPSWVNCSISDKNTLTVSVPDVNNTDMPLIGNIIISAGGQNRTVYVTQNVDMTVKIPEVGTLPTGTTPYVGAFWKASQTGERIIRITNIDAGDAGAWTALVGWYDERWNPAGDDGVVFSTDATSDLGVTFAANEDPADMNIVSNDATYSVSGNASYASGTVDEGGTIMFRMGLQKPFTKFSEETPDYATTFPARYAMVVLSYANNSKVQKLFIRQGEGADYLFRGSDPVGDNSSIAFRTPSQCKQFSPYNLTAATLNAAVPVRGGTTTAYPSQAGAFFKWAATVEYVRWAYDPFNAEADNWDPASTSLNVYWDDLKADNELCPNGYRRPTDGVTSGEDAGPTMTSSEMRQSLYLSPKLGEGQVVGDEANTNTVWGYYADGFFDRRQIAENGPGISSGNNTSVSIGDRRIAHTGGLYYNPYNNASLFFPTAGRLFTNSDTEKGELRNAGYNGYYWSSSSKSDNLLWFQYVSLGKGYAYQSACNRSIAYSVRCVKDN